MRLLDSEAKASSEAARHLEAMEQLRCAGPPAVGCSDTCVADRRELGSHSSPGATV